MEPWILALPTLADAPAAAAYIREHREHGETYIHGSGSLEAAPSFEQWVQSMHRSLYTDTVKPGWVPATTFVAKSLERGAWIGTIQIRHALNEYLLQEAGHIGYGVRPTLRRMGYGSEMLRCALAYCEHLEIERALVTCNTDNTASARTIECCGGVLKNEVMGSDGARVRRYWIDCRPWAGYYSTQWRDEG